MSLLTIFQLYHGDSFIGGGNRSTWRKRVLTTDLSQVTDKLYRIMLYLLSGIRIHNISGDRH